MKTYSVIIQNQKTMEEFGRFRPLYAESLNENRIGVCKWNEAGTTIDTALPELRSLTDDKENWRAIIVRYIDETPMRTYESVRGNPYDFIVNAYNFVFNDLRRVGYKWENFCRFILRTMWSYVLKN